MRCVDCNEEIELKPKMNRLEVTLDNPGHVSAKGNTSVCHKCGSHYADVGEAHKIIAALEKDRLERGSN